MNKKLLIAAVAIVAAVGMVSAQTTPAKQTPVTQTRGPQYVDKNENSVCDNYEAGGRRGNRNAVGRGRGQGRANANARGLYVDENKNGICDRREVPVNATPVKK